MVYNVSYRTDIPAFFWPWWSRRLEAGFVDVRNPYYPEKESRLSLTDEDVDAIVYISKDFTPALTAPLSLETAAKMHNTSAVVTANSYDADIEPNVIRPIARRVEMIEGVSRAVGKEHLTWNYNPILISDRYDMNHHKKRLPQMFALIAPYVSRFSFDFVNIYPKVARNAPEIRTLDDDGRAELCDLIDDLLETYQIKCTTCDTARVRRNITHANCHTLSDLLEGSHRKVNPRISQKTLDSCSICGRIAHRDVGTYDTCPHACRYCYANADYDAVARTLEHFDVASTMLCDKPSPDIAHMARKMTRYSKPA